MNPDDLQVLLGAIVGLGLQVVTVRDVPTGTQILVEVPRLETE